MSFGLLLALLALSPQDAPVALLTRDAVAILDGGERRVVPSSADVSTFAWDRDGRHLVVTRGGRVERLPLDGGAAEVLAAGWDEVRMPDVAPDGTRVVFAASGGALASDGWHVVLLERASGATRLLGDGYDPCFDREGRSVLYERYPGRDLWRVDVAGGEPRRAFEPAADRYTVQADPFAQRVAFSSEGALVLRDLATGAEQRVGAPGAYERFASFAPDRRHVLFFRQAAEGADAPRRAIVERDLVTGAERVLASDDVDLAAYAPPDLARFVRRSAAARGERAAERWLPVDGERDPVLRRALLRDAQRGEDALLFLAGVRELAPAEAAALRDFRGAAVLLPDLESLDAATAALLAELGCGLFLDGLATLDESTARALAAWRGKGEQVFLSLDGLRDPPVEVLRALGTCRGWGLSLEGLERLTPEAAGALGPVHVATLDLDGLATLERATAEAMSRWHAKFLSLRGLPSLEPGLLALVEAGCAALVR